MPNMTALKNSLTKSLAIAVAAAGVLLCAPAAHATDYKITVHTGDVYQAGTDCGVRIRIKGTNESDSAVTNLDTKYHNDFERNNTDTYYLNDAPQVGLVTSVTLSHYGNCIGIFTAWYPGWVEVTNMQLNSGWRFEINKWITDCSPRVISKTRATSAKCGAV